MPTLRQIELNEYPDFKVYINNTKVKFDSYVLDYKEKKYFLYKDTKIVAVLSENSEWNLVDGNLEKEELKIILGYKYGN